jgi:hypothetical protein
MVGHNQIETNTPCICLSACRNKSIAEVRVRQMWAARLNGKCYEQNDRGVMAFDRRQVGWTLSLRHGRRLSQVAQQTDILNIPVQNTSSLRDAARNSRALQHAAHSLAQRAGTAYSKFR